MFTSQHEATGAEHLESVLAIVCRSDGRNASARSSSTFSAPSLGVIEEHGTPVIMQGLQWPKRPAHTEGRQRAGARPRPLPRGSSA